MTKRTTFSAKAFAAGSATMVSWLMGSTRFASVIPILDEVDW